jgi:hypothetical protein
MRISWAKVMIKSEKIRILCPIHFAVFEITYMKQTRLLCSAQFPHFPNLFDAPAAAVLNDIKCMFGTKFYWQTELLF